MINLEEYAILVIIFKKYIYISVKPVYESDDGYFLCFDNLQKIKSSFVNDNYCDCPDGSDEPGIF